MHMIQPGNFKEESYQLPRLDSKRRLTISLTAQRDSTITLSTHVPLSTKNSDYLRGNLLGLRPEVYSNTTTIPVITWLGKVFRLERFGH